MTEQGSGNTDQGSGPSRAPNIRAPQISLLRPGIGNLLRWRRLIGPSIICVAALIATSPDLFRGNSCGHDFDFHLASWLDAQTAWRHGIFYPHWAQSPNWGAGEARFVFYPPLTWMLGAAFGLIFPWKGVAVAITCSFLAATGLVTRMLARQALPEGPATLAGCFAIFSGYSMFTAYERTALGELAGGFWIPLLLFLVFRDRNPQGSLLRRAFDGSAALLALVIAGAWLSNAPLGVMASYLLAAMALAVALLRRSWAPIVRASAGVTIGIGLSAIYLVPAAIEQRWVQIRQATDDPGLAIENSWLFSRHADPNLELHDVELWRVSLIAVIMIGLTLIAIFIASRRNRLPQNRQWWIPLALIPVAVLLLQLPLSQPVWNILPKLRFLQFPWRWLVATEAPMGIFIATAIWPTRLWLRRAIVAVCSFAFLAITIVTMFIFHQECDYEDSVHGMLSAHRNGQGFEGTDEYAPPGADNTLIALRLPDACLTTNPALILATAADGTIPEWDPANGHCDATYSWSVPRSQRSPEHLRLTADVPHAGDFILHLRNYAAWQVRANDRIIALGADPVLPPLPRRDDGLMVVPVPQGHVEIAIDWSTTSDELIGRWISGLALLLLAVLYLIERRFRATPTQA